MVEWVWRICGKIWKSEGWPEEWNERVIVPIVKKGSREMGEEYTRVTLMSTLYNVCIDIGRG